MVSWSQIPPEIKRHVVQKLDFMSRISLKNTSHLDRQIVESTKLYIPRARFGYKDGKSLVVIYTGIEKFLRLEIEKCGNGVVIQKSENSYNHSEFARKFMPSIDTFSLGLFVLKSLLIDKSINIGNTPTPSNRPIDLYLESMRRDSNAMLETNLIEQTRGQDSRDDMIGNSTDHGLSLEMEDVLNDAIACYSIIGVDAEDET